MLKQDAVNIVGLTGMSGAGKSTVSSLFGAEGFFVVDCDLLAREISSEKEFLCELQAKFEEKLLNDDGTLNRRKTAEVVFADPMKNRKYLGIIFPRITYGVLSLVKTCGRRNVLIDAPTLFEAKIDILCDNIISVVASRETCLKRITKRDGITEAQALARLDAQHDDGFFRSRSDFIIENDNDDFCRLEEAALEIAKKIRKGE